MQITLNNLQGSTKDITNEVGGLSYSTSLKEIFSTLEFTIPHYVYEENKIAIFSRVTATSGEDFKFSGIVMHVENDDLKKVRLTVVSDAYYLTAHEDIFKVKNYAAENVIRQVISNFDDSFTVATVSLQTPITKIYKGQSIIEVIDDVLSQCEGATAKKLYRTFENNTLTIFDTPDPYRLDLTYSISALKLSYDGEDIRTRVKVFTEDNKSLAVQEVKDNTELIKKAGIIQKVHEIKAKTQSEAAKVADNLLKIYSQVKRSGSFTIFGDYKARVGMGVTVEGHNFIITGLKHTFEDKVHLMKVEVMLYE